MWYDVFVVAILIVGMVRGAVRGVVWQLAGIAGIILCLVFAETISHVGAPLVKLEPPLNQWVVMFVAYLFFSFVSFGFARLINTGLEKAQLKEFNKHLGAVFGLVKGAALCLVITFFLVTLSERTRDMLKTSKSARYAAILMDRLHPVMPEKLRGALSLYIHDLHDPSLDLRYTENDALRNSADSDVWTPLSESAIESVPADPDSPFESGSPATAQSIDPILRQIPGLAQNDWLRETARLVYESTPPAQRQQLLVELQNSGPALLNAVLQRWRSQPASQPPSNPQPPPANSDWSSTGDATQNVGYSQPPAQTRSTLVASIAGLLARQPQDQPGYEQYISQGLQGLPDAISLGVLQDWQADLTAGLADPDPDTSSRTPLDQRIIRQLTLQRVPVYQLSQELQTRLMRSRAQ